MEFRGKNEIFFFFFLPLFCGRGWCCPGNRAGVAGARDKGLFWLGFFVLCCWFGVMGAELKLGGMCSAQGHPQRSQKSSGESSQWIIQSVAPALGRWVLG